QGYLRVAGIEAITPTVRRILFEPMDRGTMPFTFAAGQYVKVELPVAVEPIERSYSICSGPGERGSFEIAVKHEPDGLGSGFLHQELAVGQALRVSGPHGEFTCNPEHDLTAGALLLIAGGVGITPLMSVLVAAADAGHTGRIVLLASYRTEEEVAFRPEIEALRQRLPGLTVSTFVTGRDGRIGLDVLRAYSTDAGRVHLCGPAAMMQDVIGHLTELRVPREAIHTEAFVSGRSMETRRERAHAIALTAAAAGVTEFKIAMAGGDLAFACRPGQSVLDAANAADVPMPQSCGEGACGTCRVRVLSGAYETDTRGMFSTDELAAGWRLACQTLPTEDLTIAP
ncbi:MAG TPA: 2Fe-2S iron-sulfur cluster-binding protein, partial [Actinoplanes sp.]